MIGLQFFIPVAFIIIVLLVVDRIKIKWRNKIRETLEDASATWEFTCLGTNQSYLSISVKCDPEVREWIKKLGLTNCRCALVGSDIRRLLKNVRIIPTTMLKVLSLAEENRPIPDWAYLVKSDAGMEFIFLDPALDVGPRFLLLSYGRNVKLAQIAVDEIKLLELKPNTTTDPEWWRRQAEKRKA